MTQAEPRGTARGLVIARAPSVRNRRFPHCSRTGGSPAHGASSSCSRASMQSTDQSCGAAGSFCGESRCGCVLVPDQVQAREVGGAVTSVATGFWRSVSVAEPCFPDSGRCGAPYAAGEVGTGRLERRRPAVGRVGVARAGSSRLTGPVYQGDESPYTSVSSCARAPPVPSCVEFVVLQLALVASLRISACRPIRRRRMPTHLGSARGER